MSLNGDVPDDKVDDETGTTGDEGSAGGGDVESVRKESIGSKTISEQQEVGYTHTHRHLQSSYIYSIL